MTASARPLCPAGFACPRRLSASASVVRGLAASLGLLSAARFESEGREFESLRARHLTGFCEGADFLSLFCLAWQSTFIRAPCPQSPLSDLA